ncbi:MAG: acetate kinase [Planctomycetes bacterium]|nr:acetate kinase [Planctomycetota bacterium]
MKIFVVNCGSSSIKYKVYDMTDESVLASGLVERVGSDEAVLTHEPAGGGRQTVPLGHADHNKAMRDVLARLTDPDVGVLDSLEEIAGVGHRVVHAGERYSESARIDQAVIDVIEDHFPLSPLHNPANLAGIRASIAAMPDTPQVAVFDTAFLATLPRTAWMYPVPMEWYEKHRVRRYGFHGTSHKYVTRQAAALLDRPADEVNLITCHLGNGASITAVAGGHAVDHSMGMTPLAGVMMGTRCGDLDPAIIFYMLQEGFSAEQIDNALNKKAGILGVSGVSNDMRDLLAACDSGNERAHLALDMYVYRIAKYIGAYRAILPALDAVVLTGGIGENSVPTRAALCARLAGLGVILDGQANAATTGGKTGRITVDDSAMAIWVVPTNEELMIARDTAELV